ncbi:Fungal specific transcription factor domain [Geosmithia morbida]|uniref:Fungal specific transcription factor domain n=1 Tax=Geosmithia morbida TaxID=1094350 RepID=A0A9P4YXC1_9HYPO|nr:Fungal specific transcription factor domain [Geosmithia morbida]KAF4124242.1 Fungal specific transcription factor domain [Geosmithia morbida]
MRRLSSTRLHLLTCRARSGSREQQAARAQARPACTHRLPYAQDKSECSAELPACGSCQRPGQDCAYPELVRSRGLSARRPSRLLSHASPGRKPPAVASSSDQGDPLNASLPIPATADRTLSGNAASSQSRSWKSPASLQSDTTPAAPTHRLPLPPRAEVSVTKRCLDQTLGGTLLFSRCVVSALKLRYAKYYPVFTSSALRLQYERTDLSSMAQEVRRRLMRCLADADGLSSVGLPVCEMCPFEAIYLRLPCHEEEFNADYDSPAGPSTTVPLDAVSEGGLTSIQIREQVIRRDAVRPEAPAQHRNPAFASAWYHCCRVQPHPAKYAPATAQRPGAQEVCRVNGGLSGSPEAAPRVVTSGFSSAYMEEAAWLCLYHAARLVMFLSRRSTSTSGPFESGVTPEAASVMALRARNLIERRFPSTRFVDDSYDAAAGSPGRRSTELPVSTPQPAPERQRSTSPVTCAIAGVAPHGDHHGDHHGRYAKLSSSWQQQYNPSTPHFHPNVDPLGFEAVNGWIDAYYLSNDFSAASDSDFF